jgi:hypothetical protein
MASVYRKNCNRIKVDFDIRGVCRDMVCHLRRSFFISQASIFDAASTPIE